MNVDLRFIELRLRAAMDAARARRLELARGVARGVVYDRWRREWIPLDGKVSLAGAVLLGLRVEGRWDAVVAVELGVSNAFAVDLELGWQSADDELVMHPNAYALGAWLHAVTAASRAA